MTFYDRTGYTPHKKRETTIYTPARMSEAIHNHITPPSYKRILDIGIGKGSLCKPFTDSYIIGIDPVPQYVEWCNKTIKAKIEEMDYAVPDVDLILCNPPFSGYGHNKLYPEIILRHITRYYPGVPLVFLCPCTMISNCTKTNKRWQFMQTLDLSAVGFHKRDTFEVVEAFSNTLFFNFPDIKPFIYLP